MGGEWSASRPGRALPQGKEPPGTHCTGGWVGPRAGLDTETRGKILCPCRGSNPASSLFNISRRDSITSQTFSSVYASRHEGVRIKIEFCNIFFIIHNALVRF
jgi:hypothetical protein